MQNVKTMNDNVPIITIDGPGGSGKGTISLLVAKALQWHFLDSGAVYRVLAFAALDQQLDITQEQELANLAEHLPVQFNEREAGFVSVLYQSKDHPWKEVTQEIRTEQCGNVASKIAVFPKVREALLGRLRAFRKPPGLVADGRDMGTVVFKEASLKIYLDASPLERAKRRYLQLKDSAHNVTLQSLLTEIEARDRRDKERVAAPLKPAIDAVVIDTTGLGIEAVFEKVMTEFKQRFY